MKKQIFTLVLLGLLSSVGNVWGDELCTAALPDFGTEKKSDGKTDYSRSSDSKVGTNCTLSWSAINSGNQTGQDGKKYWKFDSSTYARLTLSSGSFQAGDKIIVKMTGNGANKTIGFKTKSTSGKGSTGTSSSTDSGKDPIEVEYTLTASDIDAGGTITIYRYDSNDRFYSFSVSGTRADKHSVTAVTSTGDNSRGTVSAASTSVEEGKTTVITAVPASGYKVTNWAVSGTGASITPNGASNSLTTTLTMGTANATVTVTFGAAPTYTISYAPGSAAGVTGSKDNETKTEDVAFTLPSDPVFSRTGYTQTGWATSDGGDKAYELGGSYTTNAAQTFYPYWEEIKHTVTYNVNGGGSCATASETQASYGASLTLPTPTWSGYTFDGWYNAGTKIGNAGASYTPTENITLYAKWTDNTEGKIFSYVDGNYGDKFKAFDGSAGWVTGNASNKDKTFTHATNGAKFVVTKGAWDGKSNSISALAKFVKGTSSMSIVIPTGYQATVKILYGAYGTGDDYKLTINGTDQVKPNAKFDDSHTNIQVASDMVEITLNNQSGTLTISAHGSKNIYIGRVAVTLTHATKDISEAGWATYCSPYALDLEHATDLTDAYIVKGGNAGVLTLESVKEGTVSANTGLLFKADEGTVTIPIVASGTTVSGNKLVGVTAATEIAAETGYVLMASPSLGFYKNSNAFTVGANTAYLPVGFTGSTPDTAPSAFRIVDEENNATDINAIEAAEEGVKFIQNGQLYIKRNGVVYDAMGRTIH